MIRRARLGLSVAVLLGVALVASQFPVGEILHTRAAAAAASHELSTLQRQNHSLSAEIAALHLPGVIARLAHGSDGLVRRGESFDVVLPSRSARGSAAPGTLGAHKIPRADIVVGEGALDPALASGSGHSNGTGAQRPQPGFFSRFLQRLEFWKAAP